MKSLNAVFLLLTLLMPNVLSAQETDWANLNRYRKENAMLKVPAKKEQRVVFMGNSITEKWGSRDSMFWKGKPYINRGISGQVTSQMLLRFRADVIELQPKVVVILAGTNDIAQNKGPITIKEIAGNIFSMVELAKANQIEVVLCSVLPVVQYKWRKEIKPAEKVIELNKLLKAYAKKNKLSYIDCHTPMANEHKGLKKEFSPDGVHPNYKGYQMMGLLFEKSISKALKKKH
ncbi:MULTISPECIES: SGNH/GDSL hydrolase family protein [unclassified Saccharicrinis]|uniref:SGNH/GDSL hydrolase family protein n=1 Tax=unclassified Saccharicrinis TaxID=2646859 RepID=UPI003D355BCC